ncbi:antichymotrypsin-1-like isoform X1 [Epargyreus clarus]|uniref:antichymotrypsin-1-like isoform X1 n=2 Tax=Epargyreus clarus TaxID=520877 RepID=UPI003C2C0650
MSVMTMWTNMSIMKCLIIIFSLFATMSAWRDEVTYERTPLGDSVDVASMKILKESYQVAVDKNVIASPLGVLTLLAMYSAGAEGENREEILSLVGTPEYKQLEDNYGNLTERFTAMDDSYLVLANKIYVSNKYTLKETFSDVASRSYKSVVETVNFAEKKKTAAQINEWAAEKTKGHISSPISEDTIDAGAALAMFNVIFFQGHWHVPFDAKETEEKDFFVDETTTVKKPMMKLRRALFYHEDYDLGARMVELPYKETGFRMVIVLPDEKNGLPAVVEKLAQRGILEDVFNLSPSRQKIEFEMPKFDIKSKHNLNAILPKVGVSHMFTRGAGGVVRETAVRVASAFQQAFVKVDEEGATAGAFTGLIKVPLSTRYKPPPPIEFKVDHPFMFAILHEDIVLFTGTYTH